jgi:hypothetical protein
MKMPEILKTAKDLHNELLDIIDTMNKWPPEGFMDSKRAAEMRMKAFDVAFQKMLKYQ